MKAVVTAVKRLLVADTTLVFLCAAMFSSYGTVIALSYHKTNGFTPAAKVSQARFASPIDLTRKFHSQVKFVSSIIKEHAPKTVAHEQLAHLIVEESIKASVDPLFVAAVIRSESMFRTGALSNKGAQGLMQIMPDTAEYVSKLEKISLKGPSGLNDPRTNVRLGVAYLKYLDKMFHGNRERILIAYNWGPANVSQSMKGKRTPPRQSVNYAREIIKQHHKWKSSLQEVAFDGSRLAAVRAMVG
jgi:soluble lytic murein transglycosylase-like protein